MNTENTTTATKGKGHFTATPLEFTLDGQTLTYAGRGRWSVSLATVVINGGKAPEKQKDGSWGWRDATPEELSAAQKLVDKIATKLKAKADAQAAKVAARMSKSKTPTDTPAVTV